MEITSFGGKIKKVGLFSFFIITNAFSQVYNFNTAEATGSVGPDQTQINTAYAATNLNNAVASNNGIQSWTVPVTGPYRITAIGAQGAGYGGYGSKMQGNFEFVAGQVLQIVVGQQGENGTGASAANNSGGGGGGSFVVLNSDSLLIAAGGGGAGLLNTPGGNASTLTLGGSTIWNGGGDNGNGGYSGITNGDAAGGGGFYTDGGNSNNTAQSVCEGGKSFLNGATGGASGNCGNYYGGVGGFGGGGSGWHNGINRGGAGGGYSGGQGGTLSAIISGGGGGSYNIGNDKDNQEGIGFGDGSVTILFLKGLPVDVAPDGTLGTGSTTTTSITTNMSELVEHKTNVKVFPNPSNGLFQIEIKNNTKMVDYIIYNSAGQTVSTKSSNECTVSFNLTELSNGVYYLRSENGKNQKLIKN